MQDINKPGMELLTDLGERIATALGKHVPSDHARAIADGVVYEMAAHWGGQLVYFPKGKFAILSKRDREIYSEFTGHNHKELARRWNVSEQHLYRIVKVMHRRDIDSRHRDLFESCAIESCPD